MSCETVNVKLRLDGSIKQATVFAAHMLEKQLASLKRRWRQSGEWRNRSETSKDTLDSFEVAVSRISTMRFLYGLLDDLLAYARDDVGCPTIVHVRPG